MLTVLFTLILMTSLMGLFKKHNLVTRFYIQIRFFSKDNIGKKNLVLFFSWIDPCRVGKQFELTLLLQSVVMIVAMFAMLHLCCTVQGTNRMSTNQHRLSGEDARSQVQSGSAGYFSQSARLGQLLLLSKRGSCLRSFDPEASPLSSS